MIKQHKKTILTALRQDQDRLLLIFAFGLGLMLLAAAPSMAVHKASGQLVCGQCHTMHNSQGGGQMVTAGPQAKLLRASGTSTHELCLSCHAAGGSGDITWPNDVGTAITPPKVWFSTTVSNAGCNSASSPQGGAYTSPINFYNLGAGGDFCGIGTVTSGGVVTLQGGDNDSTNNYALGYGHSIGAANVTPPGAAEAAITNFGCINCHDAHGSVLQPVSNTVQGVNVFRNLRVMPLGAGGAMATEATGVILNTTTVSTTALSSQWSYAGGASQTANNGNASNLKGRNDTVTNHIWPVYITAASQNSYYYTAPTATNLNAYEGMSGWCSQCHDNWHEDIQAANYTTGGNWDWQRHPVDVDMDTTTGADDKDLGATAGQSGSGVDIFSLNHYLNDVAAPVASTSAYKLPMAQGQTKLTGGTFYYGDDKSDRVFCLSCHFAHGGPFYDNLRWQHTSAVSAGSQTGSSLNSVTGCQQCHNR